MKVNLSDPTTVALLAASGLHKAKIPYALYGGLVLAAYGEPRETKDADLAVLKAGAEPPQSALRAVGLDCTTSFDSVLFGGLLVTRLAITGASNSIGLNTVDLVEPRSSRYAAEVIARALEAPMRGQSIRLVCPEDFVVLKALSTRDRDLDDAATVVRRTGDHLDRSLLEREVAILAQELADTEVADRYHLIIGRVSSAEK